MSAPLVDVVVTPAAVLGAAFVIGLAFGWCLERAGLASAPRLAAQFYLADATVFRVMFTAIVTAMIGTTLLADAGWLDLSRVYVPETFLLPQVAGGLVFGAGFVLAGLCPGTSCVAAATGRVDGLGVVLGMLAGVAGAGMAFPWLRGLYEAAPRGALTLPVVLHLPRETVVLGVTVAAVVGCALWSLVERRGQASRGAAGHGHQDCPRSGPALAAVAIALAAGCAGWAERTPGVGRGRAVTQASGGLSASAALVAPLELAGWIRDRKPGLHVFDLRSDREFTDDHVPGARRWDDRTRESPGRGDVYVLYGPPTAIDEVRATLSEHGLDVRLLDGGFEAWSAQVLHPLRPNGTRPDDPERERVADLSRYFGGVPRVAESQPAPPPASGARAHAVRGRTDERTGTRADRRLVAAPAGQMARWRRGC